MFTFYSAGQEALLNDVAVGDGDLKPAHLFLREKARFPGFRADADGGFLFKFQYVYHDDHAPGRAVPECRDAARLAVDLQLFEPFPGDAQAELFVHFPGHGLFGGLPFFDAAAHQAPGIGIPAAFQQELSVTGYDTVGAQVRGHIGLGGVGVIAVKGNIGHNTASFHMFKLPFSGQPRITHRRGRGPRPGR